MDDFKSFPYWKNRWCTTNLREFRSDLEIYIDQSSYSLAVDGIIEKEPAKDAKVRMNLALHRVITAIDAARLSRIVIYTPPPAVGGDRQRFDLLRNLFTLHRFKIPKGRVIELIDQVIGIYEDDKRLAILRSINPLWWFWKGLVCVSSGPFRLFSAAGFDTTNIENSPVGRLVKLFVMLVMGFAAVLTVLQLLGYLEKLKNLVGIGA